MAPEGDGLPFAAAVPRPASQDLPREHVARVELPPAEGAVGADGGDGPEEYDGPRSGGGGSGEG